MRIESKLCHVSENRIIIQVTGWIDDKNLGSALAEGQSVEEAEDKAISRFNKRINLIKNNTTNLKSVNQDTNIKSLNDEPSNNKKINVNNEPNDWSNELIAIDSEIERLKWTRDDEIVFLEKNLGYNNRNKITNYNDIVKYLNLLKKVNISVDPELSNRDFDTLIKESDTLLKDLSWDNKQGREYLQKEFNVSTRKQLNKEQLLSFVSMLKLARNNI